jgi:hypothetical protein
MSRISLIALLALISAAPLRAQVDVLLIPAAADATIYAESGSVANGAGEYWFAGANSAGSVRRALVRFDLSAIPTGSIVERVRLVVTSNQGASAPIAFRAHRVMSSWSEGASNPPGAEGQGTAAGGGDVTWTMRDFGAGTPWTNPGGDFAAAISFQTDLTALTQDYVSATPAGIADVQSWLAFPAQNFGWCLTVDEATLGGARRFFSREDELQSVRPFIQVTYFPPGAHPLAYCGITLNSVGLGASIGWSGSHNVSSNGFVLTVTGAPPGANGLFFFGRGVGSSIVPFGDGSLCTPGPFLRLGAQTVDASGGAWRALDLTTFPGNLIAPMTVVSFQFFYRDPAYGTGINLSNALSVPFFP